MLTSFAWVNQVVEIMANGSLSRTGYCEATKAAKQTASNCKRGHKGWWALNGPRHRSSWEAAFDYCAKRCTNCQRCRYISVSIQWNDCSWFHECDMDALKNAPTGFKSAMLEKRISTCKDTKWESTRIHSCTYTKSIRHANLTKMVWQGKPVLQMICSQHATYRPSSSAAERWLVTYPVASNGLGNRLAGLRASFELARASGRSLAIRWGEWLEGPYLQPADGSTTNWTSAKVPGLVNSGRLVGDLWMQGPYSDADGKIGWRFPYRLTITNLPLDAAEARAASDGYRGRMCAPMIQHLFPRVKEHFTAVQTFINLSATNSHPVVVTHGLFQDAVHPLWKQRDAVPIAYAQYRQFLAPTPALVQAVCTHLKAVNLSFRRPWIGLQLRVDVGGGNEFRQLMRGCLVVGGRNCHRWDRHAWPQKKNLTSREERGINDAVRCALEARNVSCRQRSIMCNAPIFVSSSSWQALRHAIHKLGPDARYAPNEDFGFHSAPGHHLPPLLEMAVLSASTVLIGTAGSSFAVEAGNLGNLTVILRDFNLFHAGPAELRQQQGSCDRPELGIGQSLLLSRGMCRDIQSVVSE